MLVLQASIRAGGSVEISFRIREPKIYPVDLYYLMDTSYSMKDDLQSVKTLAKDLGKIRVCVSESVCASQCMRLSMCESMCASRDMRLSMCESVCASRLTCMLVNKCESNNAVVAKMS